MYSQMRRRMTADVNNSLQCVTTSNREMERQGLHVDWGRNESHSKYNFATFSSKGPTNARSSSSKLYSRGQSWLARGSPSGGVTAARRPGCRSSSSCAAAPSRSRRARATARTARTPSRPPPPPPQPTAARSTPAGTAPSGSSRVGRPACPGRRFGHGSQLLTNEGTLKRMKATFSKKLCNLTL